MSTASNLSVSLPGSITASDVHSFTITTSGAETIEITPVTQSSGKRKYIETPLGTTFEASVSYYGSAQPTIGSAGNVTIGDTTFYGVCTSSSSTAGVNDVARYDATFKQITAPSS